MRRPSTVAVLCVDVSADDLAIIDRMKSAAGIGSSANLIRTALWSLADHLQIDMPNGVFDLRKTPGGNRRSKNLKISQHEVSA